MDARLVELLPQAMGLKNGDAKLIKNAGAWSPYQWGSVMRSLVVVAVYELRAEEICVVAHHDCGMRAIDQRASWPAQNAACPPTPSPPCAAPA